MTAAHYVQYEKLLIDKRAELIRAKGSKRGALGPEVVRHADLVDQSAHDMDAAVQVRLGQTDSRLLKAIDAALLRIERGTFGACEVCLQSIPSHRLNAVPWARLCRDCKERQDTGEPWYATVPQGADRWIE
jgi:RNA polymerase-binding protein DksA